MRGSGSQANSLLFGTRKSIKPQAKNPANWKQTVQPGDKLWLPITDKLISSLQQEPLAGSEEILELQEIVAHLQELIKTESIIKTTVTVVAEAAGQPGIKAIGIGAEELPFEFVVYDTDFDQVETKSTNHLRDPNHPAENPPGWKQTVKAGDTVLLMVSPDLIKALEQESAYDDDIDFHITLSNLRAVMGIGKPVKRSIPTKVINVNKEPYPKEHPGANLVTIEASELHESFTLFDFQFEL